MSGICHENTRLKAEINSNFQNILHREVRVERGDMLGMEEISINREVNSESGSSESCCYKRDDNLSTDTTPNQQQPIESSEKFQTVQQNVLIDINNEKQIDQSEVIRKICPLIKHRNTTNNNSSKVICSQKSHNKNKNNFNQASTTSDSDKTGFKSSMAAIGRLIGSQKTNSKLARKPLLRQIHIVGQLNHSASKGLILITMDFIMISTLLLSMLFLSGFNIQTAQSVVWPFNKSQNLTSISPLNLVASISLPSSSSNRTSGSSKRFSRNSGGLSNQIDGPSNNDASGQPPLPTPISQQYHYFWNHDQIEPKVMASEAGKILTEAQIQTDKILNLPKNGLRRTDNQPMIMEPELTFNPSSANQQTQMNDSDYKKVNDLVSDPLSTLASNQQSQVASPEQAANQMPIVIPPAIQQQLTSMVLAMQRQQQMSLMMQPRFDASIPVASRRFIHGSPAQTGAAAIGPISPFNPLSRFWMSASSQHPVIAPPPPHMLNPSIIGAESIQANHLVNPYSQQMMADAAARGTSTANMAGVPVYGPFMVAPSTNLNYPHHQQMFNPAMFATLPGNSKHSQTHSSSSSNQSSSASGRLASSLLSRRKSWPLFNFGSHLAERGSLFSSASQPRPTISLPPIQQQHQRHHQAPINVASLPPESMALLDAASNQLASAILSQVQARANEQKFAQVIQEQKASQDMQSLESTPNRALTNLPIVQKLETTFRPPYMMTGLTSALPSIVYNPVAQQFGYNPNQMLKQYPFDPFQSNISAFDSIPFGSRLKRRHLNTLGKSMSPVKHVYTTMASSSADHSYGKDDNMKTMNFNDLANNNRISKPPYTALNGAIDKNWPSLARNNDKEIMTEQQLEDALGKPSQVFNKFNNYDTYETLASSVPATPIRILAPTQQQQEPNVVKGSKYNQQQKRIVKKDASSLVNKKSTKHTNSMLQQQPETSPSNESNLRHLFMLMATESPLSKQSAAMIDYDSGEQTQLRRLKRSTGLVYVPETANKHSADKPEASFSKEFGKRRESRSLLKSPSSNGWVSITSSSGDLKQEERRAEVSNVTSQYPKIQSNIYTTASQWKPQTSATKWTVKIEPITSSGWIGESRHQEVVDSSLLKRQAELADQYQLTTASSSKSVTVTNPEARQPVTSGKVENSTSETQQAKPASQEPRQAKFLKIKRVTASASVLHHPTSSKLLEKSKHQSNNQKGTILAGSPVQLTAEKSPEKTEGSSKGVDPMSASLSESARVVNYFRNIENDKPESGPSQSQNQKQLQPVQVAPAKQSNQLPQINLAYSAPTKVNMGSRQNDNVQPTTNYVPDQDIRRQQPQQQQQMQQASEYSGNKMLAGSGVYSSSFTPTYTEQPMQALLSSSNLIQQINQVRPRNTNMFQAQPPKQFQVAANNADISSAATAGNLAYVKSFPQQSSSVINQQAEQGIVNSSGGSNINSNSNMSFKLGSPQSASSSFGLSRSLIGNLLTNFDGGLQRSSPSTNSLVGPIFGATSHSRQTVMTPSGKSVAGQQIGNSGIQSSYPDRSTSADQSNNYNEELLPPQLSSSHPPQSSGHSSMFESSMSSADIPGPVPNQSDMQNFESSSPNGQQQQQQNLNGDTNGQGPSFNDNNFAPSSKGLENSIDIDSMRFNQQQQNNQMLSGASPYNQTDSYVPDTPDSSSLYSSNGGQIFGANSGPNSLQSQSQMMPQTGDSSGIVNQSNQHQMLPNQNQFYSQQQLNAFGAAVADYNQQQRFNQQFQDAAIGNFNSRTRAAMFPTTSHNLQQHNNYESPLNQRQSMNNYQQIPQSSMYSNSPVDEDAAAGTLAAAGIPTYPTAAQLLAMQSHQVQMNDFSGMLSAASNKREQDDGEISQKPSKKSKGSKQGVSHHYHFNNLANPFEDPEGFAPVSPLDFVGNGQYGFQPVNKQKKVTQTKERDTDKENQAAEEEKPKKKGFLRRFSLKNLFKRFRKDKKKEVDSGDQDKGKENGGNDSSSDR